MKYFKGSNKRIHAFEDDGSQDHLITDDMAEISESEKDDLLKPDLDTQRINKANKIRTDFKTSITTVNADGTSWNGGMESALSIDGAIRLAEQAGATDITLFDAENNEHLVDVATGKAIAAAIGIDYQTKFAQKQQLMRAIASASTETELDAITWS